LQQGLQQGQQQEGVDGGVSGIVGAANGWVIPRASEAEQLQVSGLGQSHKCTVYIQCFWQGNLQIYGHIRCIYAILASPAGDRFYRWRCIHTLYNVCMNNII
jgi:hypothetical protein